MASWFHFAVLIYILNIFCLTTAAAIDSYAKPLFSTKTPYFWVNDEHEEIAEDSETIVDFEGKSCQVVHLSILFRHGARFPGLKWIRRMTALHKLIVDSIKTDKFSFMKDWSNPFTESSEKDLSELGEDEQYELGKRFGERFKLLFMNDIENVKFLSSSKQRTKASASEFHEGLMDSIGGDEVSFNPVIDDVKLRFHDNCKMFTKTVDKNSSALNEYKKFKNGPEMAEVTNDVSKKLGIENVLSTDDVNSIYQQCAFELQLFNNSNWCHLIEEKHFRVIEYLNDLKQYWKKAYGHDITARMACPLVKHMFKEIDRAINLNEDGDEYTTGVFQFGHAETLAPFYAALGLFNDSEPLKADNFESQENRLFKSSKILPFSANIAMAVYECDDKEEDFIDLVDQDSLYVIKFFVNEKPVLIPACDSEICPYKSVRDYYSSEIDKCRFEEMCSTETEPKHDEL